MNDPSASNDSDRRGQPLLAWIVILAACGYMIAKNLNSVPQQPVAKLAEKAAAKSPLTILLNGAFLASISFGVSLILIWIVLVANGRLRLRMRDAPGHGAIYAETFALWLVAHIGLGFGLSYISAGRLSPLLQMGGILLSLTVLFWPWLRGVSWRQLRLDLGWYLRRNVGRELLCGVAAFVAGLSMTLIGFIVTALIMALLKTEAVPTHPLYKVIETGGWRLWTQALILASIVAPIVEETMFRGVFYRHLREIGWVGGKLARIVFSVVLSSLLFASVHPQGPLGIPPLMGVAIVLALAREWRGTLLPSMVAHGLFNGVFIILARH